MKDLFALSYVLQVIGAGFMALAWWKAFQELRQGRWFYATRVLMFVITTITLAAYVFPVYAAICFFTPSCFQAVYRDYLRLTSGVILFLYGFFKFLLYYTKDDDTPFRRMEKGR